MQPVRTTSTPKFTYGFKLNIETLNDLAKSHGIETETDLARVIDIDKSTLWRIKTGTTKVTAEFMSKVRFAFPTVPEKRLFTNIRVAA